MESASKPITVFVHFSDLLGSKQMTVHPDDPIQVLASAFSKSDFYFQGERLDPNRTFKAYGILEGDRLQTWKNGSYPSGYDIFFRLPDENKIKMHVSFVWTFKRAAMELSKLTGLNHEDMRLVFAGRVLNMGYAFMNDSCMQKESTIHVILKQRGP